MKLIIYRSVAYYKSAVTPVHQSWSNCSLALNHHHNVKTFMVVFSRVESASDAINSYSLYICQPSYWLNIITFSLKPNWLKRGRPLWQAKPHLHSADNTANSVTFTNHLASPYIFIGKMGCVKSNISPNWTSSFMFFSSHFKFMVLKIVNRWVSIS